MDIQPYLSSARKIRSLRRSRFYPVHREGICWNLELQVSQHVNRAMPVHLQEAPCYAADISLQWQDWGSARIDLLDVNHVSRKIVWELTLTLHYNSSQNGPFGNSIWPDNGLSNFWECGICIACNLRHFVVHVAEAVSWLCHFPIIIMLLSSDGGDQLSAPVGKKTKKTT